MLVLTSFLISFSFFPLSSLRAVVSGLGSLNDEGLEQTPKTSLNDQGHQNLGWNKSSIVDHGIYDRQPIPIHHGENQPNQPSQINAGLAGIGVPAIAFGCRLGCRLMGGRGLGLAGDNEIGGKWAWILKPTF